MKKGIYWFRNDLRTVDNELLVHSSSSCSELLLIYIFDPREWMENEIGLAKTGSYRTKFILQSLEILKSNLEALGTELHYFSGIPEDIIPELCKKHEIDTLFFQQLIADNEVTIENKLRNILSKWTVEIITGNECTLIEKAALPFSIEAIPEVFTTFRTEVEKRMEVRPIVSRPDYCPPPPPNLKLTPYSQILETILIKDAPENKNFFGGENAAQERLRTYFWDTNLIASYKQTRNEMLGMDYSSKFSPWLAIGCISPRQIYWELKKYESSRIQNESTYWLVFELLWRDYFHFITAKHGVKIFSLNGFNGRPTVLENKRDFNPFTSWIYGTTPDDFINACMKELRLTGYMSNRGRQNAASYLIHDLKCNWKWGASYFESVLIDYDVCSNWGNWAYLAGVGNDPRGSRKFNTLKQAETYDPEGHFTEFWNNFV